MSANNLIHTIPGLPEPDEDHIRLVAELTRDFMAVMQPFFAQSSEKLRKEGLSYEHTAEILLSAAASQAGAHLGGVIGLLRSSEGPNVVPLAVTVENAISLMRECIIQNAEASELAHRTASAVPSTSFH